MFLLQLMQKRAEAYMQERMKYGGYMMSGGLVVAALAVILISFYYYGAWLQSAEHGPVWQLTAAAIWSVLLLRTSQRLLVKPADMVFLLPAESRIDELLGWGRRFTFLRKVPLLLLGLVYTGTYYYAGPLEEEPFALFYGIAAGIAVLHVIGTYFHYYVHTRPALFRDRSVPACLTAAALLGLFFHWFWLYGLMMALYAVFVYDRRKALKMLPFQWQKVQETEHSLSLRFYRAASQFAEVPFLPEKIRFWKKAGAAAKVVSWKRPMLYISILSFIRRGSYLQSWFLFTGIGSLLLFYSESTAAKIIAAAAVVYLYGRQLSAFPKLYEYSLPLGVYPVKEKARKREPAGAAALIMAVHAAVLLISAGAGGTLLQLFYTAGAVALVLILNKNWFLPKL
ncbi:putative ABC-type exoprotein transport system permease subunit [Sinobaca qinghaiensis]|uniref:Putative ABC-type exoprotein transport system permease subunit n=1 Tax=Sinobaca qinghaiensis TaxID=342944 RepID=A0A419V3Y3_9BACL|nr:ABC transporter permease [Sinobaca qinghaiensis]RKD73239.1 putative ABC-type exoprotein transport system permease subunit [Sinobaca qinghaiensis]